MELRLIEKKIINILNKLGITDGNQVDTKALLTKKYGMTSIIFIDLIMSIEKEFNIEVDEDILNIENFDTIQKITKYLTGVLK